MPKGYHRTTQEQVTADFWSKVNKTSASGCWLWTASTKQGGYGIFTLNGRNILASRFSWMLVHNTIPSKMYVLHRCDNPPCVNPEHLFLGTANDNTNDCIAKGRGHFGKGWAKKCSQQTHCKRGHEYTPENTKTRKEGWRNCLACARERTRTASYREKRRVRAAKYRAARDGKLAATGEV